jgi:hypothetical protein
MKLTKNRLKEIIKEELLNELHYTPEDKVGFVLADLFNELEDNVKKLNKDKAAKWGKKYHKSARKLIEILTLLNKNIKRIR